jgi:molybdenum cofactor cytidylyltransferase
MGFAKAFEPLAGRAPLERIATTLDEHEFVVVAARGEIARANALAPRARAVVANDDPQRGMSHSLRLGIGLIASNRAVGVLLADMPFITRQSIERIEALLTAGIDVAYPIDAEGRPGHPVIFAPRARTALEGLADGDTLRVARDDARLARATAIVSDRGSFVDLDYPSDWKV